MTVRKRWVLLALYLALLGASHLWRALGEASPRPQLMRVERVAAVDPDGFRLDREIDLAYREWGPEAGATTTPPIVMLQGSPGSSRDFRDLAPEVAAARRVIAPDLPGFGASERDVPDYSVRAHADYTLQLLDRLGVDSFDVLGFSMGGGVAIELAREVPERVRSLTLLSAIGVQELELLGNYQLNRALHGLQLAGLWLLHEGFPHFGTLDDSMLSVEYARNFYDTDQRPLRAVLETFEAPALVLHGDDDPLVPLAVAQEHHRILPQSRLVLLAGNHFMTFFRGAELAEPLTAFLADVDAGVAPRRGEAEPERLEAASQPWEAAEREPASGFSLVVVVLLLAVATLISEDLACIGAGLLVAHGSIAFAPAVVACLVGIVAGDIGLYWAGRLIGTRALRYAPLRWMLTEDKVAESAAWLEKRGIFVILMTRFVPGTRLPTYFTAGMLRAGFWRFTGFFLIASVLWTPLLVGLASTVGEKAFAWFETFQKNAVLGLGIVVVIVWVVARVVPALATWRGRRLVVGRFRRLAHWEYWPWWVVYIPVAAWVGLLAIRHRSLSLFTLANPGMAAGGFVGESKGDLLAQMPTDSVPAWLRLVGDEPLEEKRRRVQEVLERPGVDLPLVLKPDSGERGFGVEVARTQEAIDDYLERSHRQTLVQEWVGGEEFGVFYVRRPGEERGRVTSVTRKIPPTLTGDGRSTLDHLILLDERAVCYAHAFLARHAEALQRVPAAGEVVALGDLGTHARGAQFLDGNDLRTPELEETVERIARSVDGFYFGRFDLRAPSAEHLMRGAGVRVLELNGVTSEEAHIYDPRYGVFYAWKTLMRQWSTAFAIGSANRARGLSTGGTRSVLLELWRYRRRTRPAR